MNELFSEIQKAIWSNEGLKTFLIIGMCAASLYFIMAVGKEVGRFVALLIK